MHYSEQVLLKQQLLAAEKILNEYERLYNLSEPPLKEYVVNFRRMTEWTKKAPLGGEWELLGDIHTKMLETALKVAKKMIDE